MSVKTLLTSGWSFSKHPLDTDLKTVTAPETVWVPVDLPHDWLIGDVANLYGPGFVAALSAPPSSAFIADGSAVTVRRGSPLA